jgi:hypothetical protein
VGLPASGKQRHPQTGTFRNEDSKESKKYKMVGLPVLDTHGTFGLSSVESPGREESFVNIPSAILSQPSQLEGDKFGLL